MQTLFSYWYFQTNIYFIIQDLLFEIILYSYYRQLFESQSHRKSLTLKTINRKAIYFVQSNAGDMIVRLFARPVWLTLSQVILF